jgi:death-on-curing protein
MEEHLTVEDPLVIAEEAIGAPTVRDIGLLDSAAHRPQASAFGRDGYPTMHEKAAALLEAIVRNHALSDGNERLAWAAVVVL